MQEQDNRKSYEPIPMQMEATRRRSVEETLNHLFTYHDDPAKIPQYRAIRTAGKHFAEVLLANVPDCSDRSVALRCIREAVLWANAGVALDGAASL